MSEFKRSRCIFIDLGLVRATPSITVVQKFLLMVQSAGAPIWFVFVTFGLGHLLGIRWESVNVKSRLIPNSSVRQWRKDVCLNTCFRWMNIGGKIGASKLTVPFLLEKKLTQHLVNSKTNVPGQVVALRWWGDRPEKELFYIPYTPDVLVGCSLALGFICSFPRSLMLNIRLFIWAH